MTHPAIERFTARRAMQEKLASRPGLSLVLSSVEVLAPENCSVGRERTNMLLAVNRVDWDRTVSRSEVTARLAEFSARYDRERAKAMWRNCRRDVLRSIAGPFGVGKIVREVLNNSV